jgi:hypothetical protein
MTLMVRRDTARGRAADENDLINTHFVKVRVTEELLEGLKYREVWSLQSSSKRIRVSYV